MTAPNATPTARRRNFDEFSANETVTTQENQVRGSKFSPNVQLNIPGAFPADTPPHQASVRESTSTLDIELRIPGAWPVDTALKFPATVTMHDQNHSNNNIQDRGIIYRLGATCSAKLGHVFSVVVEQTHKIRQCLPTRGRFSNAYRAATQRTKKLPVVIQTYRAAVQGKDGCKRRFIEFSGIGSRNNARITRDFQPTITTETVHLQDTEMSDVSEGENSGSSILDDSSTSDGESMDGIDFTDDGKSIGGTESLPGSDTINDSDGEDAITHSSSEVGSAIVRDRGKTLLDEQLSVQRPGITPVSLFPLDLPDHYYDSDRTDGSIERREAADSIDEVASAINQYHAKTLVDQQPSPTLPIPIRVAPTTTDEPRTKAHESESTSPLSFIDAPNACSSRSMSLDSRSSSPKSRSVAHETPSKRVASTNRTPQSFSAVALAEHTPTPDEPVEYEAGQIATSLVSASKSAIPVTPQRPVASPHTPVESRLSVSAPRLTVRQKRIKAEAQAKEDRAAIEAQIQREIAEEIERAEKERATQFKTDQAAEWLRFMGREEASPNIELIEPLSAEWNDKVDLAMQRPGPTHLATTSNGTNISRRDFGTVLPQPNAQDRANAWLNDEIINSYIQMAVEHGLARTGHRRGQAPKYHAFPSQFYNNLKDRGPESVKRWAARAKIGGPELLKADSIFIPVNQHYHWTLLVISPGRKTVEYFDSLSGASAATPSSNVHTNLAKVWLRNELGAAFFDAEWTIRVRNDGPQQNNSCDCGVFCATTAKMIVLGWDPKGSYEARHIPVQRRRMVAELMVGEWTGEFAPKEGNSVERMVDVSGSGDFGAG